MNNGRALRMQIVQAFKDLPSPVLDGLWVNFPMLHTISSHKEKSQSRNIQCEREREREETEDLHPQTTGGEKLSDHVDGLVLIINPRVEELDDVFMFQGF